MIVRREIETLARLLCKAEGYDPDYVPPEYKNAAPQWRGYVEMAEEVAEDVGLTPAALDVTKERQRQVSEENWSEEHDNSYRAGELSSAAACYALGVKDEFWPWIDYWWKPSDRRRDLVKAGALILAEIERLDRTES